MRPQIYITDFRSTVSDTSQVSLLPGTPLNLISFVFHFKLFNTEHSTLVVLSEILGVRL